MVEKNCNKDDTYTQWEEADTVSVQLTFSQLTCPSGNACDLKQDVKYLRVLMRCFRAAFSVYESLYMCFSANTLPHFFGLIKFFFGSWLSEKWKMPLTPHSLGLHKLLGLFSPAVRPIINRSVLAAFVWIVLFFIFPPNTREVKTASWFCFTGEAEKDCALLWILLTSGATKIISKEIWFLQLYHDDNSGADYWSGRQPRHEFTKCVLDIWIVAGMMRLILRLWILRC